METQPTKEDVEFDLLEKRLNAESAKLTFTPKQKAINTAFDALVFDSEINLTDVSEVLNRLYDEAASNGESKNET